MSKRALLWLIAIVLFAAAIRLVFFSGIGASDDLLYTRYAYEVSKNSYSFPSSHQGTRLGLLYTISFFYNLFGVNEFSSNAFVFLTSIVSVVLIFYFGKVFFNEKVGLLAAFLLSFFPLEVVFATKLSSDMPSSFFLSLCIFFFLVGEKYKNKLNANISYFLSGISIGMAYLIRETALLVLLFFGAYTLFYKKVRVNYLFIFIGFMAVFMLESLVFQMHTGNFLYRYSSLSSNYEQVAEANNFFGRNSFPFSLFNYPYLLFTSINLGLFYPFVFIAIFYCLLSKKKETYPFIIWFIVLLLYLSFGTVSFSRYIPFAGVARYLAVVTFPALLLLAFFLSENELVIRKALRPSITALLLLTSIGFIYLDKDSRQGTDNLKQIYPFIKQLHKTIYADQRSKLILEYFSGYNNELNIVSYKILESDENSVGDLSGIKDGYVLLNHKVLKGLAEAHPFIKFNFPEQIIKPPQKWIVIKKIGKDPDSTILYYVS